MTPAKATDIGAALRCTFCKQLFRVPKQLSCGHCFCHECVQKLGNSVLSYPKCPECNQTCNKSERPVIFQLQDLVEIYKTTTSNEAEKKACIFVTISEGKQNNTNVNGITATKGTAMTTTHLLSAVKHKIKEMKSEKLLFTFCEPDTPIRAMVDDVFAQLQAASNSMGMGLQLQGLAVGNYNVRVKMYDRDFKELVLLGMDKRVQHLAEYHVKLMPK